MFLRSCSSRRMGCGLGGTMDGTESDPVHDPCIANIHAQLDLLEGSRPGPEAHEGEAHFVKPVDRQYHGLGGGAQQQERQWQGNWTFAIMADVQLGMLDGQYPASGATWETEMEMAARCVAHINTMNPRPKFACVCGDLVDAPPPCSYSTPEQLPDSRQGELNRLQMADFKRVFSQVDPSIPLVCVCGNHDVGDMPNRQTVALWKADYGDDYYEFWCGGCKFLVLNSQLFAAQGSRAWEQGSKFANLHPQHIEEAKQLAEEQVEWLSSTLIAEQQLDACEPTHSMLFTHMPPFLYAPDEPDGTYNCEASVRQPLLELFKQAGYTKWFCGHYHSNTGGWDGPLEVVITAAAGAYIPLKVAKDSPLAIDPWTGQDFSKVECTEESSGMRIVKVGLQQVQHTWYNLAQLDRGEHKENTL